MESPEDTETSSKDLKALSHASSWIDSEGRTINLMQLVRHLQIPPRQGLAQCAICKTTDSRHRSPSLVWISERNSGAHLNQRICFFVQAGIPALKVRHLGLQLGQELLFLLSCLLSAHAIPQQSAHKVAGMSDRANSRRQNPCKHHKDAVTRKGFQAQLRHALFNLRRSAKGDPT